MIAVPNYIDPNEYLLLERNSNMRHEYRSGLVYAMAGGSDNHARIALNLIREIDDRLGTPNAASITAMSKSTIKTSFTITLTLL